MAGRFGRWANARVATPNPSRGDWAAALFVEALPAVEAFTSPRAWAFTLLGLDGYCALELARSRSRDRAAASAGRQVDVPLCRRRDAQIGSGSKRV